MNDFLQSLRNNQAEKQRTPKTRKNFDNSYQYSSGPRFHSYGGGSGYGNARAPQMKQRQPLPGMGHQAPNQIPADDPNSIMMTEVLDNLATQVDTLIKNQEYLITVQERTADLMQRQAEAIEMIMAYMNINADMNLPEPAFENHYMSSQEAEDDLMEGTVEELLKAEMEEERRKKETAAFQPKPVVKKRRKVVSKTPAARASKPAVQEQPAENTGKLMPREEIMEIIDTMREQGATYDQVAKRLIDLGQPTFSGRGEWHAQTIHRLCSKK